MWIALNSHVALILDLQYAIHLKFLNYIAWTNKAQTKLFIGY